MAIDADLAFSPNNLDMMSFNRSTMQHTKVLQISNQSYY